jgi:outer membrane protein OmpA-like peptidoglycan-associated protein
MILLTQTLFARDRYAIELEAGAVAGLADSLVKDQGKSGGMAGAVVRFDRSKHWDTGFGYNVLSLQNGVRLRPATLVGDRRLIPRGPWAPYARIGAGLAADQSSGALNRLVGRGGIGVKRPINPQWDAGINTELWFSPASGTSNQDMILLTAGVTLSKSFARVPPKEKKTKPADTEATDKEDLLLQSPVVAPSIAAPANTGILSSSAKTPDKSGNYEKQELPKEIHVLFRTEKWTLTDSDYTTKAKKLEKAARYLLAHDSANAEIHGHADTRGPLGYNIALSRKRANTLRDLFVDRYKIAKSRFTVFAHGSKDPIATNATPQGRAKNRRGVVIVLP